MKVYKTVVYIYDFEERSEDDIIYHLENNKYLSAHATEVESIEIDDWTDDHPLNQHGCDMSQYFKDRVEE